MHGLSLNGFVETLEQQHLVLGFFLFGAGLVFSLMGVRIYRVLVPISFGVVGFVLGASLPVDEALAIVCALVGAVGLGALSTLRPGISVGVLAGICSALAAMGLLLRFDANESVALVVGLAAAAVAISLTIIMFYEVVAYVTSLEGMMLVLAGLVVLFNQSPRVWLHIRAMLLDTLLFAPFLILAGTVAGFYFQLAELRQKRTGIST
jgi:hypothetical protein